MQKADQNRVPSLTCVRLEFPSYHKTKAECLSEAFRKC